MPLQIRSDKNNSRFKRRLWKLIQNRTTSLSQVNTNLGQIHRANNKKQVENRLHDEQATTVNL